MLKKNSRGLLVLSSLLFVVTAAATTATTFYMGKIVDCAVDGNLNGVFNMLFVAIGIVLLWLLLNIVTITVHMKFVSGGTLALKHDMMKNILRRSLSGFRKNGAAYYMNLLGADADIYRQDRLNYMPYLASEGGQALFAALALVLISPWLCLAGVVMSAFPLLSSGLLSKITQKRKEAFSAANETYTSTLKETMEGYETIRMEKLQIGF